MTDSTFPLAHLEMQYDSNFKFNRIYKFYLCDMGAFYPAAVG